MNIIQLKQQYHEMRSEGIPRHVALDTLIANNPEINSLFIRLHIGAK